MTPQSRALALHDQFTQRPLARPIPSRRAMAIGPSLEVIFRLVKV
jgi:hypothetical protein